jgi:hypothetical protein
MLFQNVRFNLQDSMVSQSRSQSKPIVKPFITRLSSASYYFIPLRSKYPQNSNKLGARVITTSCFLFRRSEFNYRPDNRLQRLSFSWFSSITTYEWKVPNPKFVHDRFLPHSIQFIIHHSSRHRTIYSQYEQLKACCTGMQNPVPMYHHSVIQTPT